MLTLENPHTWAYRKLITGQNLNIYVYDRKVREYHRKQKIDFMEQVMKRHNEKAIASSLLTRRQREKYREQRSKLGKNTYYIFPAERIPADIGARVRITKTEFVYI